MRHAVWGLSFFPIASNRDSNRESSGLALLQLAEFIKGVSKQLKILQHMSKLILKKHYN